MTVKIKVFAQLEDAGRLYWALGEYRVTPRRDGKFSLEPTEGLGVVEEVGRLESIAMVPTLEPSIRHLRFEAVVWRTERNGKVQATFTPEGTESIGAYLRQHYAEMQQAAAHNRIS